MSNPELAALITALGVSIAGIITAIAALRNANYNATKAKDLEERINGLRTENKQLQEENKRVKEHSDLQDRVIVEQQGKINKWQVWGDRLGREFNVMQLEYGAIVMQQRRAKPDKKKTGPLEPLPFSESNIQRSDD
jgi:hypothetical protein